MYQILTTLTRWLLPQRCSNCHAISETPYCTACLIALPLDIVHHQSDSGIRITSLAPYNETLKKLLHSIKFDGHHELAMQLATKIAAFPLLQSNKPETPIVAVPAPSVATRSVERGFHHVETLFAPLCHQWQVPLVPAVIRSKETTALHHLGKEARWEETNNAFTVILPDTIVDQHILIVDDILTSGATIDSLAITLMRAGAASVSGLVLATGKRP